MARGVMVLVPMASDLLARRDPHLWTVGLRVLEEGLEARRAPRAPDEAAVKTDAHHLGVALAPFLHEVVEGVGEKLLELPSMAEAVGNGEAHVVFAQRVGHDEVGLGVLHVPVG
eukprot:CAMPEP_0206051706 /NCGR_PEP_ID=MMETSP1466-20131121/32078_1 /ASSEMBLY_ACC=CAM_ASM_001126 /TAXON_ID=44452 /ORGANISM="Pavlova gyrans, Strain CCMP608" /LENGTH=113 /DNA_ID=CAMNT_0053426835 /DNA_START=350 /DNA_END=691 /DNA_ORIENTATION=-